MSLEGPVQRHRPFSSGMKAVRFRDMSDSKSTLADARNLEDIHFNEWIVESARETEGKIKANERKLAAQGLALSGNRVSSETEIIFTSIEAVIDKAIVDRRELSAKVPALLESETLTELKDKLERYIQVGVDGVRSRSILPARSGLASLFIREAETRAGAIKARLKGRLSGLPLEAKLGLHQSGGSTVNNFNISYSTIANLNLGTVVGDLNSSIQQLNTAGQKALAEEFRKMTGAIGGSQDLNDEARKEMLEHLSVVSEESAKPPEQRKMGPVKSSLTALKSALGVAAPLFSVYQGLEHALKAAGVIH
jgi:hypothetical protein